MQPINNDKRKKEWILFKESGKTEVGRISKKRVKNKIEIEHWNKGDDKENFIQEGLKLKRCQEREHELLVPIKLFNFKPSINEITTEQLKKEPAILYLAIEPLEERILKECIKSKKAGNKEIRKYRKEIEVSPGSSHQALTATQTKRQDKELKTQRVKQTVKETIQSWI
ncbi:528_t:CDS:2, partial [Gigaspora margarita]